MRKLLELIFLKKLKGFGAVKINRHYLSYLEKEVELKDLCELIISKEKGYTLYELDCAYKEAELLYKEIASRKDLDVITIFDEEYPSELKLLGEKQPIILYVKGRKEALTAEKNHKIAVVGTRKPSEKSLEMCKTVVGELINKYKTTIISGLALGCDQIAHKETLNSRGTTIAILPSGFDNITPATNKKLATDIILNGGCLVTEYEPSTKALKSNFVRRDALIAALSATTLVIECGITSGTMHTVNAAHDLGKQIACCYPKDREAGDYKGNEHIIKNLKGIEISRKSDLEKIFMDVKETNAYEFEEQLKISL